MRAHRGGSHIMKMKKCLKPYFLVTIGLESPCTMAAGEFETTIVFKDSLESPHYGGQIRETTSD